MSIYACLTTQGTAMPETALCGECLPDLVNRRLIREPRAAATDWEGWTFPNGGPRYGGVGLADCSGNDALSCIACGAES